MLLQALKACLNVRHPVYISVRTATKRTSGTSTASNSSAGRRLGRKKTENEFVKSGQIIWRQRGTVFYPGENCGIGRDHTIFALEPGYVRFYRDPFHAKRRFIGVALKQEYRLPTPHFEPRRRRFGYTKIEDPQVLEYEKNYLTRKETQQQGMLEEEVASRAELETATINEFREVCRKHNLELTDAQAHRLLLIKQYISGGLEFGPARHLVDELLIEDLDADLVAHRITAEQRASLEEELTQGAQAVDAVVGFGRNGRLAPLLELQDSARTAILSKLDSLVAGLEYTPPNVVAKIQILLDAPCFSHADVYELRRKYVRPLVPIAVTTDNEMELAQKVKDKCGEIRQVHIDDEFKRYYIPEGAELVF